MQRQDGATLLHCHARIKNTFVHAEDRHWLSFYTTIEGYRDIRCLFHYYREDCSEPVAAGMYHICAAVR